MFTGIVEETGIVKQIKQGDKSIELAITAKLCAQDMQVGGSLAINGCCLTLVRKSEEEGELWLWFDLLRETWVRTNLQYAKVGSLVNLERPLRANAEMGGHFVTGHIDNLGKIIKWERAGQDWLLDIEAPEELMKYMVFKGSVSVDGISLTVADVGEGFFRIWIIPHTMEVTALKERTVGSYVNLEADILGKYVEKFVSLRK
ncbi:MAG: riboflavin synthase [Limisphaerales bacterium]|jgi:riboflavin synthase|nr:riboflavin synthase [Verrucomicrobiota bacterium]